MGRKIDMKKIENTTKCQVTFSKRRSSLMKKANELSVCCDIDVAIVAFSPSGRVSKFSNQKRIGEVLLRYVNLPTERRLNQLSNVQAKLEKLKMLSHINGDYSKLHYLDKQIENLELQIKKRCLELQILETDLRDYEVAPGHEASLHQLSWCERNLNQSLERVLTRKMELVQLETQSQIPFPTNFNQNDQVSLITQNPIPGQILMQLDPWISPYCAKVRESIFQDLVDQAIEPMNENIWLPPSSENVPSFTPIQELPPPLIPPEQPLIMDQPLSNFNDQNNYDALLKQCLVTDQPFNFQDQNNDGAYNACSVVFSDAMHMSTENSCNVLDPRNPNTMMETTHSLHDEMGMEMQCMNSEMMSQFNSMDDNTAVFSNDNNPINYDMKDMGHRDLSTINQMEEIYQPQDPYSTLHHDDAIAWEDAQYLKILLEGAREDNNLFWAPNREKGSLWDWEEFLRD